MADIFDEVGEDLRRDRLKRFWDRYSWAVIAIAVLIVGLTAGWRIYEHWRTTTAAAAGDRFEAALAVARSGEDPAEAAAALTAFAADAPGDYAVLAAFRAASERAAAGDTETALAAFERLAADASLPKELRDLATIRAAMLAVDVEDLAAVKARVAALDTEISPWRFSAWEVVALAAVRAEQWEEARTMAERIISDRNAPRGITGRAQIIRALVVSAAGETEKPADGAGS